MLRKLTLEGVGPAKRLEAEFSDRLNLITGDNGLGKSFLLDVGWWALTRTWPSPDIQALPRGNAKKAAIVTTVLAKGQEPVSRRFEFDFGRHAWPQKRGRPWIPGLVLYARVDGGFSVWDPARNYWKEEEDRPSAFSFAAHQVWSGLQDDRGRWRCNGLYRDWGSWQREKNQAFEQLKRAIQVLSPPGMKLEPGDLERIGPDDSTDYPTLKMPYGIHVPLVHASAALRRILALAYLLIWSWQEHLVAARQRRSNVAHRIVFLVDEVEAHLHPAWQRRILPSLLDVVNAMQTSTRKPEVQVIATTHSPLVCASLEPMFDSSLDRLLTLDFSEAKGVSLDTIRFEKLGSVAKWLESDLFRLDSDYPERAARAMRDASELVKTELQHPGSVKTSDFKKVDHSLRELLSDTDPFWVTWRRIAETRRWSA